MHVIITGAGGMLGQRLARALASRGSVNGRSIAVLTLADLEAPAEVEGVPVCRTMATDITDDKGIDALLDSAPEPAVVFHLAAVVSGAAEADTPLGYRVNLRGTQMLLEALNARGARPRFVFASSLAVFGGQLPPVIPDDQPTTPQNSYGAQKAMGEMLVNDYSRKGLVDGVSLRLPTIVIRPGRPNAAASGFYSSILREPMAGERAVLPVPRTLRHWFASPASAVGALCHAAEIETASLGLNRALNLPGVSATVQEMLDALERTVGSEALSLIDEVPDPEIERIVTPWPQAFAPERALSLGFRAEESFDEIVEAYLREIA